MKADLRLPRGYLVAQRFEAPRVGDLVAAVRAELFRLGLGGRIRAGQSVAITAGSRGILRIAEILKAVIAELAALGARPFVVPAMGSHGGGSAEGQRAVLAGLGITEEAVGCEIRASMDVVELGQTRLGTPVFMDRHAATADHIAVINRVKLHTKLSGEIESGLLKMCLIGLGKAEGARVYHRAIEQHSWMEILGSVYEILLNKSPIGFGLAILQNAYGDIAGLCGVTPQDFWEEEKRLLARATALKGHLPFERADLLIVDEMGKEISGTGMDTNLTGRKPGLRSQITRVFVRDLTEKTRGNAQGIGLADFTTKRLVDRIDFAAVYLNSQTAYRTDSCKIPMHYPTDRQVLAVATAMSGIEDPAELRWMWIKNTLEIEQVVVSEAYAGELESRPDLSIVKGPFAIALDSQGNLLSPFVADRT